MHGPARGRRVFSVPGVRHDLRTGPRLGEVAASQPLARGKVMPRSMIHPYFGTLVICAEIRETSHRLSHLGHGKRCELCDGCGSMLWACLNCGEYLECCPCG